MNISARLRQLFLKCVSSVASLLSHRSYATPVSSTHMDTLPDEVIAYIFALAAGESATHLTSITISHVNSRWRGISLSTGNLWARITVTFPITPHQLTRVNIFLTRSGTCPLLFFLDLRDPDWDWQEETHKFRWQDMEFILRILLVHVSRWKSFELLTDTWAPIFTFLWYTEGVQSAPMLESLHLSRCNAYVASRGQMFHPASLRIPKKLFGNIYLPRLRYLSLVGVHVNWTESPLRNLTSLELKYHSSDVMPSVSEFSNIFAANPGLLKLAIGGWGPILSDLPEDIFPQPVLELPILRHLDFGIIDMEYAKTLLSLFHFPALEELKLEDVSELVNPGEPHDATYLLEWLAGTSDGLGAPFPMDRIRILKLHGINSHPDIFTLFLSQFSSVNHLRFSNMQEACLHSLRPQPPPGSSQSVATSIPCPLLTELHCQDISPETLIDILLSRSNYGSVPLTKVSLGYLQHSRPSADSSLNIQLESFGIRLFRRRSSNLYFEE